MSWLRVEGRMPQHHKIAPLSDAAFRLHMTAMAWSTEGRTDGRIPKTIPETLTRAPRGKSLVTVLSELLEAGVWLATDGGYEIHDYLEWNLSSAQIAEKSAAKVRAGAAGGRSSGQARGKRNPSKAEAAACPPLQLGNADAEAKPKPLPSPLPPKEEEQQQQQQAVVADPRISCPSDLQLAPAQRATLECSFMPGWAIDILTVGFVSRYTADSSDRRTLEHWRKCLSMALCSNWNDSSKRPQKPVDELARATEQREAERREGAWQAQQKRKIDELNAAARKARADGEIPAHLNLATIARIG